jgi:hypothetical protein
MLFLDCTDALNLTAHVRGKATLYSRKLEYTLLAFKFDEFQPHQPSRNSVIEKLILFSISEDDKSVLPYPAKKLS